MYFVIVASELWFLWLQLCEHFCVCDFFLGKCVCTIFQLDKFILLYKPQIQNCNLIGMHFKSQQLDYP